MTGVERPRTALAVGVAIIAALAGITALGRCEGPAPWDEYPPTSSSTGSTP